MSGALPEDARRIAVVCPSWVGDTIMATPALRALRAHRPDATLIAVARPGVEMLLAGCPWIDERRALSMKGVLGPLRAARALRGLSADAVILLPNSFRTAFTARLARIPRRLGYDRDGRGALLTDRVPVPRREQPTPAIDYYVHLVACVLGLDAPIERRLELFVTDDEEAAATAALDGVPPRFAVLNPGGNKPAKRWPAERFAAVADALYDRHGVASVVSGAPGEADVLAAVVRAARTKVTNIAGPHLSLGSLKAIARRAAIMITNDTGPRHIAAAVGTPLVTLFGPTDHRWTTLHIAAERILLAEPFLPAETIADANAGLCRVDRIAVEDVVAAACDLLEAPA